VIHDIKDRADSRS
jgi:hypothetical protein